MCRGLTSVARLVVTELLINSESRPWRSYVASAELAAVFSGGAVLSEVFSGGAVLAAVLSDGAVLAAVFSDGAVLAAVFSSGAVLAALFFGSAALQAGVIRRTSSNTKDPLFTNRCH